MIIASTSQKKTVIRGERFKKGDLFGRMLGIVCLDSIPGKALEPSPDALPVLNEPGVGYHGKPSRGPDRLDALGGTQVLFRNVCGTALRQEFLECLLEGFDPAGFEKIPCNMGTPQNLAGVGEKPFPEGLHPEPQPFQKIEDLQCAGEPELLLLQEHRTKSGSVPADEKAQDVE